MSRQGEGRQAGRQAGGRGAGGRDPNVNGGIFCPRRARCSRRGEGKKGKTREENVDEDGEEGEGNL